MLEFCRSSHRAPNYSLWILLKSFSSVRTRRKCMRSESREAAYGVARLGDDEYARARHPKHVWLVLVASNATHIQQRSEMPFCRSLCHCRLYFFSPEDPRNCSEGCGGNEYCFFFLLSGEQHFGRGQVIGTDSGVCSGVDSGVSCCKQGCRLSPVSTNCPTVNNN